MRPETRGVPVSLRERSGSSSRFLADHPVGFRDGVPEPFVHEGRRYSYSHTNHSGGYRGDAGSAVYVFVEDAAS